MDKPAENRLALQPDTTLTIEEQVERIRSRIGANGYLRGLYDDILGRVNREKNRELIRRYGATAGFDGELKYIDCAYWLWHKLGLAIELGLDKAPPLRLLDLGTGAGHLCAVANSFGHKTLGLDVENEIYGGLCELLGVTRIIGRVDRRQPLQDLGQRFDLITALSIVFDLIPGGQFWSKDDWRWFLDHLIEHHLQPSGQIFFWLNSYRDEQREWRIKNWVADVFTEYGGTADGNIVRLKVPAH